MPKKSLVWNFFNKIVEGNIEKVKCKQCSHTVVYHKNTTNLKDHLKRKHPLQLAQHEQEIRPQENVASTSGPAPQSSGTFETMHVTAPLASPAAKKPRRLRLAASTKEVDREIYDKGLIRMIVTDYQLLSIVENKGFNEFVNILQPSYVLPSRKIVSEKLLSNEHLIIHKKISDMIENISHLSITTDLWSSDSNISYITITGHFIWEFKLKSYVLGTEELPVSHTALNIGEAICNVLSKFPGSLDKISVIVTDNASNVKKAVTGHLRKIHHPCVAHTLNLSVQESITKCTALQTILSKCRALHAHFKNSNVASYKLKETQKQMLLPFLKLKKDEPTRCNSILFMIERFSEIKIPLSASLISLINAPENLEASEWAIIDDVTPILKPVHKMTEELSEEEYSTLSRIIPLVRGLQHVLSTKVPTTNTGISLKNCLIEVLSRRFGTSETHKSVALSTLLDPRFKKAGFELPENASIAEKWLTEELAHQIVSDNDNKLSITAGTSNSNPIVDKVMDNAAIGADKDEVDDLWKLFDQKALSQTPSTIPTSSATLQIKQYLEMPLINRKLDPLNFWKTHCKTYPNLSQLAIKYLCIPASSVPSERVFSKEGMLTNQRRNRLAPKKLNEIIFLNKNLDIRLFR